MSGSPINVNDTLQSILPGLAKIAGGGKTSSQSSVASNVSVANSVNPNIIIGSGSGTSGGNAGASGYPTTGAQSASLPDYLPGLSSSGLQAGYRANVVQTPNGVAYDSSSNNTFLLLAGAAGLVLLLFMGDKKGAK